MARVTLTPGLQPGDYASKPDDFFKSLGADQLMFQCGYLHDYNTSKDFVDRILRFVKGEAWLMGVDSHLFNNWTNDDQHALLCDTTFRLTQYAAGQGAGGVVLDCEQENHLIPYGKGGRYTSSDPKFVWPAGSAGPMRCRNWVSAVRKASPSAEIVLWLTSAVQLAPGPNFYPCVNAMCEEAKGARLWPYMWEPGYDWGANPNLPKKGKLPKKPKEKWDAATWCQVVRQSFTQNVNNTVTPCLSLGVDTVEYYQPRVKRGEFKDYRVMMDQRYIDRFKQGESVNLIIWGDIFAKEPAMEGYIRGLIKELKNA